MQQSAELSEEDAAMLSKALHLPFTLVYSIGGVLVAIGLVIMVVGLRKRSQYKVSTGNIVELIGW